MASSQAGSGGETRSPNQTTAKVLKGLPLSDFHPRPLRRRWSVRSGCLEHGLRARLETWSNSEITESRMEAARGINEYRFQVIGTCLCLFDLYMLMSDLKFQIWKLSVARMARAFLDMELPKNY